MTIEYRFRRDQYGRLPILADDLSSPSGDRYCYVRCRRGIRGQGGEQSIPVVFGGGSDPIQLGLVPSSNRPGGNLTGWSQLGVEVGPKRLELLHEVVPTATIIALLVNPANPIAEAVSRDMHAAARKLGLQLHLLHASTEREFHDGVRKLG